MESKERVYIIKGQPLPFMSNYTDKLMWGDCQLARINYMLQLEDQQANNKPFAGPLEIKTYFYFTWPKKARKIRANNLLHNEPPTLFALMQFVSSLGKDILFMNEFNIASFTGEKRFHKDARTEIYIKELT